MPGRVGGRHKKVDAAFNKDLVVVAEHRACQLFLEPIGKAPTVKLVLKCTIALVIEQACHDWSPWPDHLRNSGRKFARMFEFSLIPGRAGTLYLRSRDAPLDRSIVEPQFGSHVFNQNPQWEPYMKRLVLGLAVLAISFTFAPAMALAQGRGSDAALGAVSGAVVLGPVGAVAGAVIGYTAGPSIAHSWGLRRSGSKRVARERSRAGTPQSRISENLPPAAASPEPSGTMGAAPPKFAPAAVQPGAAPPVQSLE